VEGDFSTEGMVVVTMANMFGRGCNTKREGWGRGDVESFF